MQNGDEGMPLFESHFSGQMVHFLKVFGEVIKFNFGPFSGARK